MKLDEYASPSLNNWNVHSSRIVWNLLYLSFLFQFSTDWTLLFFQTQLQHWPNPNLGNSSTKEWVVAWTSLDIFYGSCRRFLGQGTKFESLSATCPPRLVCTCTHIPSQSWTMVNISSSNHCKVSWNEHLMIPWIGSHSNTIARVVGWWSSGVFLGDHVFGPLLESTLATFAKTVISHFNSNFFF